MKARLSVLLALGICIVSFRAANETLFAIPEGWPKPIYDFSQNKLSAEKIELGKALFYDPILSRNNLISCASCHSQYTAFTHVDHALSHGIEDRIGTRNAPVLMNLAWQNLFMHDGAVHHLDLQALAPISNENEMDESLENVVLKLQSSKIYPMLFEKAFGDSVITGEHTLKSISQFMLTLVSNNSKYDRVMRNQAQFTEQESKGYYLFQKNCSSCHREPLFTNNEFMNNGLALDTSLNDLGRYNVSQDSKDSLKFKVPTLRNIEFSYPYMHDGRFKKLSQVLNHYTGEVIQYKNLAPSLQSPITLNANEKVEVISFLLTLTDKTFLFNPQFAFPKNILLQAKD